MNAQLTTTPGKNEPHLKLCHPPQTDKYGPATAGEMPHRTISEDACDMQLENRNL